jgi:hypothetical protein
MNITFPPKRSCTDDWSCYVQWLESVHAPNVIYYDEVNPDLPVFAITFRNHDYAFCPFCGVALNLEVPMVFRHPSMQRSV